MIQNTHFSRGKIISFLALTATAVTIRNSHIVRGFTSFFFLDDRSSMVRRKMLSSSSLHSADATDDTISTTTGSWPHDTNSRHRVMERCIVPLSSSSYKGSSGRVGILGGSSRYTGAPYYAAMASLKVGADLAFCFCAEEAAVPIKSYSPELMVVPVYKASEFDEAVHQQYQHQDNGDKETEQLVNKMVEEVCFMMDKMHVLVLGPGLGRCPLVLEATSRIIRKAQSEFHLPLVIDADALFLLTLPKYRNNLLSNDSLVILTPNAVELKRIRESDNDTTNKFPKRCLIIEKGAVDIIQQANSALSAFNNNSIDIQADNHSDSNTSTSTSTIITCDEVGGLKRSGGIGDILAGTVGTLVAWNNILTNRDKATYDDVPLSCWTACCIVKQATKVAFDRHRRSMTAPDIIQELGPVIDRMTTIE